MVPRAAHEQVTTVVGYGNEKSDVVLEAMDVVASLGPARIY